MELVYEMFIIREASKNVKLLLVGNKSDILDKREVSNDVAEEFAKEFGCEVLETSAKNGSNVQAAFRLLVQSIPKTKKQHKPKAIEEIIRDTYEEIPSRSSFALKEIDKHEEEACLLYTSPSPRDGLLSRMPSSA
eukprot:TRINITY_DN6620_c0_g2_i1.p2 TRINITY_DN6620_c0_g2~~TRINITY_DN6620_c0_g2_i1.p2  ORF type:complete len:135 (+),score=32.27 TRINITY_DN6620_c0_g2_i1:170-574(+)